MAGTEPGQSNKEPFVWTLDGTHFVRDFLSGSFCWAKKEALFIEEKHQVLINLFCLLQWQKWSGIPADGLEFQQMDSEFDSKRYAMSLCQICRTNLVFWIY